MNTMKKETAMLDKIANAYYKAESKEMKAMWKEKWYELIKIIGRKLDENKRLSTDTRQVH